MKLLKWQALKIAPNCVKLAQIAPNYPKLQKIASNCFELRHENLKKIEDFMPSTFRNPKKLLKLPETALNCPKLPEIARNWIASNCPKLPKIAPNCQKKSQSWPNLPKIATNSYHSNCMKSSSIFTSTIQRFELLSTPAIVHQNTSCHRHSKSPRFAPIYTTLPSISFASTRLPMHAVRR